MNKEIVNKIFPEEVKAVEAGRCPICKEVIKEVINLNDFRDHLSIKEYKISGMCQACQDKLFGE